MSGWTSGRGILHKNAELVVKQLSVIKENLPFAMNSLFFDNGIEFIKHLLVEKFKIKYGLDVARAAYSKYEDCEERGSIRLATLAKAAEAMDCELVYAIRPKSKKYFSNIIWGKLLPQSQLHHWIKKCDPRKRGEALASIAIKYMSDPKFREKQGWSQRANK